MKSRIYGAFAILAAALIVSAPFAQAQTRIKAGVPFAFNLQDKAMPAGNYQIIALSDRVLEFWNLDSKHGQLVAKQMSVESFKDQSPKLVFHKYGDQYFLSQVWNGDSHTGIALSESKREKEAKMASLPNASETVIVALK
jgi:hypothetical protein